jgi:actin-related protein
MDLPAVVIDNGSYEIKAGFSGEPNPEIIFPSVVSRNGEFVGHEAITNSPSQIIHPIKNGKIVNWDRVEDLWRHAFTRLGRDPNESVGSVLLMEPANNPKSHREKTAEILFETFRAENVYLANSHSLAMYATGIDTGLSVNFGYDSTSLLPLLEGNELWHMHRLIDIGGRHISDHLKSVIKNNGVTKSLGIKSFFDVSVNRSIQSSSLWLSKLNFNSFSLDDATIDMVKTNLCCVSKAEITEEQAFYKTFRLPDGNVLGFGSEQYKSTELLFNPSCHDNNSTSIQQVIIDILKELHLKENGRYISEIGRIVLSGRGSMFDGIRERLALEVKKIIPSIEVKDHTNDNLCWYGGSKFADHQDHTHWWVPSFEYDNSGSSVVHRICNRVF